MYKMW